ncbi:MAG: sugar transferase [Bacteroidales bacterium]|nr:sugar transferase [Bacteroidales bacterium]
MSIEHKNALELLYIGGDTNIINLLQEDSRYTVHNSENSLSAIRFLSENEQIDAIICEMYLPGINGIEINKLILTKNIHTKTPFVILVHKTETQVVERALKNKIDDVIHTPINNDKLFTRLNYLKLYRSKYADKKTESFQVKEYRIPIAKRLFDIVFASMALLAASPILLLIIIFIRIESKGKVYYISKRVGTGYRVFDFYKLRSMFTGADQKLKDLKHLNQYESEQPIEEVTEDCPKCNKLGHPCSPLLFIAGKEVCENLYLQQKRDKNKSAFIKIVDDPRVTKVGSFIRKTSIDELPQLINVIKGDMSIVGNRPLPLYEAEQLTSDGWSERFLGPAGITGLWQVNKRGKSEMSDEERKALDNQYARNNSFWGDIRIILKTIPALFQKENV